MLFLSVYRIDGELELALSTRHPHPSMSSWAWAFSLSEGTDPRALLPQRDHQPPLTVSPTTNGARLDSLFRSVDIEPGLATIRARGGVTPIASPTLVHQVTLDLRRQGTRPLSHQVSIVGDDGASFDVWGGAFAPALVNALRDVIPWERHVLAHSDDGVTRLSDAQATVLSSFYSSSTEEHRALEAQLRAERGADVDVDNASYLVQLLRGALGRFAPRAEHGPGLVRCALQHSLSEALITVTTTARPTALTLQATLPTAPSTSLSMTMADGIRDAIRNLKDVRCGVSAVDRAYIIGGDVELARAVGAAAADRLLSLGRHATLRLDNGAMSATTTTTDLHPGAHASLALRLAELWESLLRLE